jgi:hypothetical protein
MVCFGDHCGEIFGGAFASSRAALSKPHKASRGKARNRRRADVVAAPDVGKGFVAGIAALDRLALLVIGELERSAHFLPARHGPRSTFASAREKSE